ncbi:MAG: hypothetical protein U1E65_27065 [Myxococcota bacterium]
MTGGRLFILLLGLPSLACLEPLVPDEVPPSDVFGKGAPGDAPSVENDPAVVPNLHLFTQHVAYLRGFADGKDIWYWNADGANASFIAPMFVVTGTAGQQIGAPIIDVLPGDVGYTPWWRTMIVKTTASYKGEKIWSRAAIDQGVKLGILSPPEATTRIVDCPVALEDIHFDLNDAVPAAQGHPTLVWYRGKRAYWIQFSETVDVPLTARIMPIFPVLVLQRINQGAPIYEFATGIDVNGDGLLNASNNIFSGGLGTPTYSPLWYPVILRVTPDVSSIDTTQTATVVEFSAANQLVDAKNMSINGRVLEVTELKTQLINCPIQAVEGQL